MENDHKIESKQEKEFETNQGPLAPIDRVAGGLNKEEATSNDGGLANSLVDDNSPGSSSKEDNVLTARLTQPNGSRSSSLPLDVQMRDLLSSLERGICNLPFRPQLNSLAVGLSQSTDSSARNDSEASIGLNEQPRSDTSASLTAIRRSIGFHPMDCSQLNSYSFLSACSHLSRDEDVPAASQPPTKSTEGDKDPSLRLAEDRSTDSNTVQSEASVTIPDEPMAPAKARTNVDAPEAHLPFRGMGNQQDVAQVNNLGADSVLSHLVPTDQQGLQQRRPREQLHELLKPEQMIRQAGVKVATKRKASEGRTNHGHQERLTTGGFGGGSALGRPNGNEVGGGRITRRRSLQLKANDGLADSPPARDMPRRGSRGSSDKRPKQSKEPGRGKTLGKQSKQQRESKSASKKQKSATKMKKPKVCQMKNCRKRLGITSYPCRCDKFFCSLHAINHECKFDYHQAAKKAIKKANPKVAGKKIDKL